MTDIYEVYTPEEQDDEFWEEVALSTAWTNLWSSGYSWSSGDCNADY